MKLVRQMVFIHAREATTAIEFGIIALPLLSLIFGIMEFGRMLWTQEALQQTAIAGARCMGMTQASCGNEGVYSASLAQSYVQTQAANWSIALTSSNITLTPSTTCGGVGGFSQVSITFTMTSIAPYLLQALTGSRTLTAVACFPNHN
jgi:Flp pilus assembly protein TadG